MKYVIYARKSSESEERQALSIQSQIIEMQKIAEKENLDVVKIFQESKSAKAPGRPVFNDMVKFLEKGKADGILCWKIDRLARNPVDEGTIRWLLQGETIKQIKTSNQNYDSEDNVVIASIEFSMANQYIRDLSKNVKRGLNEKVRRGEYPSSSLPIGYVRDLRSKKIKLDRKNWHYIKRIFQLYATGFHSTRSLAEKISKEGMKSKNKKNISSSVLYRILTSPMYFGWFLWKGELHKGIHAPIISKKLFDNVQAILFPKAHHNVTKRDFIYRGVLTCGECGLAVTAETKKGHNYYRCTKSRGSKKCSQKYLREEDLAIQIKQELEKIDFDPEVLDLLIKATKEKESSDFDFYSEERRRNQKLLEKNRKFQESLVDKFVEEKISESIYENKIAKYKDEEASLEDLINRNYEKGKDVIEKMEMIAKFSKLAFKIFKNGTDETRKEVVSIISSNIVIKDKKIASFSLKEPFCWLMESKTVPSSPRSAFEPFVFVLNKGKTALKKEAVSAMCARQDSNLQPSGPKPDTLSD